MDSPETLQQAIEFSPIPRTARVYGRPSLAGRNCNLPDVRPSQPGVSRGSAAVPVWREDPKRQFSVKLGTIFEDSPIALKSWLLAVWMVTNCKNGISSYELHRAIGVTQKTAWFMNHRIRRAMQAEGGGMLGGEIEIDETYIGGKGP